MPSQKQTQPNCLAFLQHDREKLNENTILKIPGRSLSELVVQILREDSRSLFFRVSFNTGLCDVRDKLSNCQSDLVLPRGQLPHKNSTNPRQPAPPALRTLTVWPCRWRDSTPTRLTAHHLKVRSVARFAVESGLLSNFTSNRIEKRCWCSNTVLSPPQCGFSKHHPLWHLPVLFSFEGLHRQFQQNKIFGRKANTVSAAVALIVKRRFYQYAATCAAAIHTSPVQIVPVRDTG